MCLGVLMAAGVILLMITYPDTAMGSEDALENPYVDDWETC